ncbi:hypothetical protein [Pseudonocardia hierapolitana]|uniref:hypothetical protein n=1 Tax=Pseudonocardia hierapolitana TaxID=1128676 RepID=UPI00147857D2|nr:hypothetical protein [Pseudonocardia hierapolitana]
MGTLRRWRFGLGQLEVSRLLRDGRRVEPSGAELRALLIDLLVHRAQFRSSAQLVDDPSGHGHAKGLPPARCVRRRFRLQRRRSGAGYADERPGVLVALGRLVTTRW